MIDYESGKFEEMTNRTSNYKIKFIIFNSLFLLTTFLSSPSHASPTQGAKSVTSGSELFLGGNFIELGISAVGNFGTEGSKPATFFGTLRNGNVVRSKVGMSADHDGFGQGLAYSIDYFLPGSPEERFSFGYKVGGTTTTASNSGLNSSDRIPTTITNTSSGSSLSATILTTWPSKMTVQQKISFEEDDKFFRNEVTLTNISGNTMDSARFMRSFDPDNTVDMALGSQYTTKNTINFQSPADGKAQVTAESSSVVTLSGRPDSTYPIVFYSADTDARVSLFGFANRDPYASSAYDSAGAAGSTVTMDQAINIAWQTTNLANNSADSFVYYTSLDQRDFTEVITEIAAAEAAIASPSITPSTQTISGTVGSPIASSSSLSESNFSSSVSYSVTTGDLPAGLSLDPTTGVISGTPAEISTDTITITGVDSVPNSATTSVTFDLTAAAPAAPTGLSATVGNTQVVLSWTAGSDGGAAISDYVIEYSTDNSSWSTFADGTSTSTSATVTGLTNGTLYYFRVKATNSVNTGAASSNATATPAVPVSSGGGGSTTPTVTPTPTPTETQTPRTRRTILPTPNQTPQALLPRITPTPTPTQTPQAGSPTRPVELVKKAIEEVVEVLKPRIVDLNTLINPTANPDPVASANASSAVNPLPTASALALVTVPEEEKRVADIPSSVLRDGVPEESRIIVIEETKSQVVTGDGGLLTVEAKAGDDPVPVDSRGRVQMVRENSVETEGQGMAPESEFAVYLFSDPLLLGVGKTDLAGRFFASFPVEDELPLGDHTLQVVGITPSGEQRTVSMPVVVVEDKETAKAQALPETILVDQNPVEAWYESINYLITILLILILVAFWWLFGFRRRQGEDE